MVNIIATYKKLFLHKMMKLVGITPQLVEIEPGTVINIWAPTKITKNNEGTKPDKPVVVLLHGFAGDGILTWQFQVFALTCKYAVYVPDFLFFGGSFTNRPDRSPEFQAECLATGLKKLGVEKCVVVGFSYGGMVGFKMAEKYPDLVESMVVTCSVMALTESITSDCLHRIGFSSWSDYLLPDSVKGVKVLFDIGSYKFPWFPDFVYMDYLKAMLNYREEKAELLEALVIRDDKFKIHNYPQRIHLLWGENDKFFNMEIAHNLKQQIGEKATMQCISKAGHLVVLERPFVYTKQLKKSLASLIGDEQQHK